jgi:hypothetical protein
MRGIQSVRNLDAQLEHRFDLQRLPADAVLERHPVQKLHHDKRPTVLLPDFMDGADIGMVQGGCRLRLTLEPSQRLGVFCNLVR